ncbi:MULTISPECIES: hypothetical protein [Roseomonadaceae]|uniref:Uncharacterized protein n=1 Tax=Falsiroseomonas oleicola TaxID=2801474 RepID=A0ABS6HAN6_9PROT|nr:hypothetical protein [Roseomonas oleicola]MBU8545784.1 hypothetical protein [Roseomonas oleicola]
MAVRVYRPKISVTLIKTVQRSGSGVAERFSGAARQIDLTPFLSDGGAVKVIKGIAEPAGAFAIAFSDRLDQATRDTLSSRIEAMDLLEIRGARQPHLYAGQPLPLLMRGFVSSVRRVESMQPDGTPQRSVVIQGHDAGKLWQIQRFFFESIYANADAQYLNTFRLQTAVGIEAAWLPVSEMMRQLTERVINAKVRQMSGYADRIIPLFKADRLTVPEGLVSANLIAPFQGAFWGLVELVADRPWNEAFIEDAEDGPSLVFRPTPYKDLAGRLIMAGATDPGTIDVTADDLVSLDVGRSDARVANFFMTPAGTSLLDANALLGVAEIASGSPFDSNHPNNRPELYGLRKMEAESRLLPDAAGILPSQVQGERRDAVGREMLAWHIARARDLRLMNRDNAIFEDGSATLKGGEHLRPGRYLRITRGQQVSEFYMPRVVHSIIPLGAWTTTAVLERGTGFITRVASEGSPYIREGFKGPYDA